MFLRTVARDVSRLRHDPMLLVIWLAIPLLIGGLVTSLIDGGGKPSGVLLIVDHDDSLVSRTVVAAFGQGELGEIIIAERVTEEDGLKRIHDGEASGLLTIPEGFGEAWLLQEPSEVTLLTNPSQTILPGIIENVMQIILDGGFYLQRLLGDEIRIIEELSSTNGQFDEARLGTLAIEIGRRIEAAGPLLLPPAVKVEIDEPETPDSGKVSMSLLFLPGVVLMSVLFAVSDLSSDVWRERENGTLRRLVRTPQPLWIVFAGKGVAAATLIVAVAGSALALGCVYHGVNLWKLPLALLWLGLGAAAMYYLFALLQMSAGNRKSANLVSTLLIFPLLMAGGSFVPMAALPDWLSALGEMTPNGFIAATLSAQLTGDAIFGIGASSWALLCLVLGVTFTLTSMRLQTGFARG